MVLWKSGPEDRILENVLSGGRLTPAEALFLYDEGDFLKIQYAAREMRMRLNPPADVTYTMFRVVNYTNYCNVHCTFCSFMDEIGKGQGYVLSRDEVLTKMEEAVSLGARQMFLQGGVNPELPFDYYLDILRAVKERFGPDLHIRAFSPVELMNMETITGLSLGQVLETLKSAGLDSVPGAGAEILTERMRAILAPQKASVADWVRVMETCHEHGLPGSANIVFGSEETRAEVIEHLNVIRSLQDRTGGFFSFIPWTFQKQTKKFFVRNVTTPEYLKVLGITRLFLDNIRHIETSIMVLGPAVGGLALHSGADDISSIVLEENVLRSYGLKSEEKARELISENGFNPLRRTLNYQVDAPVRA
ncbi:MAG: CofH family radical SAM protein [Spirochaetales bacterium]|nr:CofH family radical SAM protein [Spirochaetales bacterium]